MLINSLETIRRIFDECRTIAVVGLSSDSARPSHSVASSQVRPATPEYLQPLTALQVSSVQTLLSLQVRAVPAWQTPDALHTSRPLQSVVSSHGRPATGVNLQPTTGSEIRQRRSLVRDLLRAPRAIARRS